MSIDQDSISRKPLVNREPSVLVGDPQLAPKSSPPTKMESMIEREDEEGLENHSSNDQSSSQIHDLDSETGQIGPITSTQTVVDKST